jgi:ATP-binding cassette subfamily B protein
VDADRIVVLENGHLVEQGTHEELLDLGARYSSMWNRQLADEEDVHAA